MRAAALWGQAASPPSAVDRDVRGPRRLAVSRGENGKRSVRVAPAGIRDHPKTTTTQELGLTAEAGPRPCEGNAIRGDPQDRDDRRLQPSDLGLQGGGAGEQLLGS